MKISVSIIIPTFNEQRYLPKLLKSIQSQTVQPKEIIVADAYSTDKTREVARRFGCKVINGGMPPRARNLGAKAASQPLLIFLDADVILPKSFLEETITEMVEKDLDIASCYLEPLSRQKIDHVLHEVVNYYFRLTKKFHPHVPGACIFVRKQLHNKIKGFDERIVLAEDQDYVKRAKKVGRFSYLESYRIPVSIRRLSKEGRLAVSFKYLIMEIHLIFLGSIRKKVITYKFGDYPKYS